MIRAFSFAGQISSQFPQPRQSRDETCILYSEFFQPFAFCLELFQNLQGCPPLSALSRSTGLIAACGHTNEHWLHCIQVCCSTQEHVSQRHSFHKLPFLKGMYRSIPLKCTDRQIITFLLVQTEKDLFYEFRLALLFRLQYLLHSPSQQELRLF